MRFGCPHIICKFISDGILGRLANLEKNKQSAAITSAGFPWWIGGEGTKATPHRVDCKKRGAVVAYNVSLVFATLVNREWAFFPPVLYGRLEE
jgi:hypothetical protein